MHGIVVPMVCWGIVMWIYPAVLDAWGVAYTRTSWVNQYPALRRTRRDSRIRAWIGVSGTGIVLGHGFLHALI